MPFIGNKPSNNFVSLKRQDITGDGTASYTLDYKVASVNDILVYVNHVKQDPSSMTVSDTSLTMGGNVASTDDFYVIFLGQALQTVTPADNTITNAMVQDGAIDNAAISSSAAIATSKLGAGAILQVKQTVKTDSFTTTSTSYVDITGFSVSITPTSTSSKILVMVTIGALAVSGASGILVNLKRGTTTIVSNSDGGSADTNDAWSASGAQLYTNNDRFNRPNVINYLDSPSSTSAQTYKCQILVGSGTGYFNRWGTNTDQAHVSTITVMEIAG